MRTGIVAKKLGMTHIYDNGVHIPVSVLSMDHVAITAIRTEEKDGYNAVQVGAGMKKMQRTTKAELGHFAKNNVEPRHYVCEFRVSDDCLPQDAGVFSVHHFAVGQFVDVTGVSKGKGFAGAMKRHNFGGGRATHGNSLSHRSHGSTGQCQDPGRVFKGKKMAGHMGNKQVTTQNLKIVKLDEEKDLIFIKGAVPGSDGSYVKVFDSVKKIFNDNGLSNVVLKAHQTQEQENSVNADTVVEAETNNKE